jgi:hypothetical protein
MPDKYGEFLEKKTKIKQIFYFYNDNKKIISKEVYIKQDKIIHYPRYFKFDFKDRYKNIEKFIIIGFKGNPPVGINKVANKGYGFTRITSQFGEYLDKILNIKTVVIEKDGKLLLDKKTKTIFLNEIILAKINTIFSILNKRQKEEKVSILLETLKKDFPKDIELIGKKYRGDELALTINKWDNSLDKLSQNDKNALIGLFHKLSLRNDFFDLKSISSTKQVIESHYLKNCILEYSKLLKQPKDTSSLEKKWQKLLREQSWIFSYIFSQPVILHKDEAYVGGKNIDNQNGKFSDFLVKNKLTSNVSFLEIKTHKSKLLDDKPYRGSDVFSVSESLSGCINQVLNQRDNFQKEYYSHSGKSKEKIKLFNSGCIVLIGCLSDLSEEQQACFEIFRNNSRDVVIITFDELEQRIKTFYDLLQK